jgi:hypothetical protein
MIGSLLETGIGLSKEINIILIKDGEEAQPNLG